MGQICEWGDDILGRLFRLAVQLSLWLRIFRAGVRSQKRTPVQVEPHGRNWAACRPTACRCEAGKAATGELQYATVQCQHRPHTAKPQEIDGLHRS